MDGDTKAILKRFFFRNEGESPAKIEKFFRKIEKFFEKSILESDSPSRFDGESPSKIELFSKNFSIFAGESTLFHHSSTFNIVSD